VEIETQLMIAQKLGYISPQRARALLDTTAELGKVLNGLIASIKSAA
jgi:four helix bundle protein